MKIIGRLFAVLSLIGMVLGLIPLLGWLNWLNIPLAILGLVFSVIGKSRGSTIICSVAIIFGGIRLLIGGGIL
jgi:hypothetical protein